MKPFRFRRPAGDHAGGSTQTPDALHRLALDNILEGEALRARVAQALHDGLGQSLGILNLHLYWLTTRCDGDAAVRAKISEMQQVLDSTNRALERLAQDCRPLRPPADAVLAEILDCQARQCRIRHGIPCTLSINGELPALPQDLLLAIVHLLVRCLDTLVVGARGLELVCDHVGGHLRLAVLAVDGHQHGVAENVTPEDAGVAAWVRALGGDCDFRQGGVEIALPLGTASVRGVHGAD